MPGQLGTAARSPELSPPRVAPIEGFTAQRVDTAEMQPLSATENTRRLLNEEPRLPARVSEQDNCAGHRIIQLSGLTLIGAAKFIATFGSFPLAAISSAR